MWTELSRNARGSLMISGIKKPQPDLHPVGACAMVGVAAHKSIGRSTALISAIQPGLSSGMCRKLSQSDENCHFCPPGGTKSGGTGSTTVPIIRGGNNVVRNRATDPGEINVRLSGAHGSSGGLAEPRQLHIGNICGRNSAALLNFSRVSVPHTDH